MKKTVFLFSFVITVFSFLTILSMPIKTYALDDPCSKGYSKVGCPDQDSDVLESKVGEIIGYGFMAVGALAVIFLIWGGLSFAMSAGNPEKVKKAKYTILFALIGLAVAISANVIVGLVINTADSFRTSSIINSTASYKNH